MLRLGPNVVDDRRLEPGDGDVSSFGVDLLGHSMQSGVLDGAVTTVDVEQARVDDDTADDEQDQSACTSQCLRQARAAIRAASSSSSSSTSTNTSERQLRRALTGEPARELGE